MQVRRATADDDFAAIAEIYARSWQAAYRGIVPQEYLDGLTGERWGWLSAERAGGTLVLMDGGRYVGTSFVCASRDPAMAGWGEIVSLYLLPEYWGSGGGAPLFAAAVDALGEIGFADIYLSVLRDNARARRFYEKNGFAATGDTASITIAGAMLEEVRYARMRAD